VATRLGAVAVDDGELRFTVDIAGREHEIWLTSSEPLAAGPEAAAVATLLPAMAVGAPLELEAPVAQATLDGMREAQAILASWARSGGSRGMFAFAREIEIMTGSPPDPQSWATRPAAVAAFFSGGVDSFSTVLGHPEITHLIHVEGFDVGLEQRELAGRVRAELEAASAELGRELIVVRTNLRELSDLHVPWATYFGTALAAVAVSLSGAVGRVLIASGITYDTLHPLGSHPMLDQLWGRGRVEIVHDGARIPRVEKVRRLAMDPVARRRLRVCWETPEGDYNCGRCEKCLRTLTALEVLGVRRQFLTFPDDFSPDLVAGTGLTDRFQIDFWRDNLELAIREQARPELIEAIEACLATAPPAARALPAAEVPAIEREREPMLYMRPETFAALAAHSSAVILIGSYDGSGNYGDVAQLESAVRLLEALGTSALLLPVTDLRYQASHRRIELPATTNFDAGHVLVFAYPSPSTDHRTIEEGLIPAVLPASISYAPTYLYGGGFMNVRWADRLLDMIAAAADLGTSPGVSGWTATSSGLQIEPGWARRLGAESRGILRSLEQIGVRDELSRQAGADLAGPDGMPPAVNTGDDAVGTVARALDAAGEHPPAAGLTVNLHVCAEPWVTDDPAGLVGFISRYLEAVAGRAGGGLRIQPLIAYDDGRISERPQLEAVLARCLRFATMAEPIALQPATLASALQTMRRAAVTVSCSYHVSLTSLLAGVPSVLLFGNEYYAQKAGALRRDFPLGEEYFCNTSAKPEGAGAALAARLEPHARSRDHELLAIARDSVLQRRQRAERELLEQLAPGSERARAGGSNRRGVTAGSGVDALVRAWARLRDDRAAVVEQAAGRQALLDEVERSASWRVTAPLRAAKRLGRPRD